MARLYIWIPRESRQTRSTLFASYSLIRSIIVASQTFWVLAFVEKYDKGSLVNIWSIYRIYWVYMNHVLITSYFSWGRNIIDLDLLMESIIDKWIWEIRRKSQINSIVYRVIFNVKASSINRNILSSRSLYLKWKKDSSRSVLWVWLIST